MCLKFIKLPLLKSYSVFFPVYNLFLDAQYIFITSDVFCEWKFPVPKNCVQDLQEFMLVPLKLFFDPSAASEKTTFNSSHAPKKLDLLLRC